MGKRSNSRILEMIFVSIDIVYTSRQFKFSTAYPRNPETLVRTNELKKILVTIVVRIMRITLHLVKI